MSDVLSPEADRCAVRRVHPEAVRSAQARLREERTYVALAALFGALADATRAKIVQALLPPALCTVDLAGTVGISESGTSQHLRILRTLGLVKPRRAGKVVYYSLDDDHVALLVRVGLTHLGYPDAALPSCTEATLSVSKVS